MKMRFAALAAMLALVVAAVSFTLFVPGYRPTDWMARRLAARLDTASDSSVAGECAQIAQLDQAGTEVLVRALGHPRSIVSSSAGMALHAQLDQWTRLPARASSPRVARLAALLAARVNQCDGAARSMAGDLATRLLSWPVNAQVIAKPDLIANCEQVLRAVPTPVSRPSSLGAPAEPSGGDSRNVLAAHAVISDAAPSVVQVPLAGAPGGDLPIQENEVPPLPPSLAGPPTPQPVTGGVPRLIEAPEHLLPRVMFPDERPAQEPRSALPASPVPRELAPDAGDSQPLHLPLRESSAEDTQQLQQLPDLDLMHRLRSPSAEQVQAAKQQLQRRGFDAIQLVMARQLTDPDPQVRRQLAESLTTSNVSPGPWLFWLSYDPDPVIRQLVVSLMATSQDPRLHRRLREMESLEANEAVRAQLDRLQGTARR